MIYLDNAATTRPSETSLKVFCKTNQERFFNPSSAYSNSFDLAKEINDKRKLLVELLGGDKNKDSIIFTSGATESNNMAVFGSTFNKSKKYLFSMGEHPSVYNCACELKNKGYDVGFIPLSKNGQIDYEAFEKMCDKDVCFVSTMFVNNETGAKNDLIKIRNIIDSKTTSCFFHVDAVQGFGKIRFSVTKAKIDLCSISSHKIGGIKGIGALYVSNRVKIKNINFGGGQEFGFRSGTVNGAGILSFCSACEESFSELEKKYEKAQNLKNLLISELKKIKNKKITVVSDENCSPFVVSLLFENNRGETIMRYLDSKGILVSTGSACSSNKVGNRILENMGFSKKEVLGSLRISFFNNDESDVLKLIEELKNYIKNINA